MNRRVVALAAAVALVAVAAWLPPVRREILALLEAARASGPWGPPLGIAVFAVATVLCVPFWLLAIGSGYVFGAAWGAAVAFAGNSLGGAMAFAAARTIARRAVASAVEGRPRWKALGAAVAVRGFRVVLLTRLSPVFPSNLLNYLFGAMPVSFRAFLAASWIGMLPTLAFYVYAGTTVRSIEDVAAGRFGMGAAEWAFLGAGLAVTAAAAIYVGRLAGRARAV